MARAPDSRMEQAKQMYLSGKKLVEIADFLGIPEGTVRSWKNRYQWDASTATLQKKKRNVVKKRGGQPGNKNAEGHGAPSENKNAVTTGEFETLFFDCLEEKECRLAASIPEDKYRLLLQEIQLLTIREHRMLIRIEWIKKSMDCFENGKEVEGMTLVSRKVGTEKGKKTDLKEYQGKLGQIQSIEEALTRVQARKQRAIEALHRFGLDEALLKLKMDEAERESVGNEVVDDWIAMVMGESDG